MFATQAWMPQSHCAVMLVSCAFDDFRALLCKRIAAKVCFDVAPHHPLQVCWLWHGPSCYTASCVVASHQRQSHGCLQVVAALHEKEHFIGAFMPDRLLLDSDDTLSLLDFTTGMLAACTPSPALPCPALPSYATDNTLPMCFHVLSFTQTLLMFNMAGSTFTVSHSHLVFTHKPLLHPDPNLRATAGAALQSPFLSTTPPQATTIMSTAAAAVFPTSAISLQPPAVVAGASALQHVSPTSCVQPVVDMQPEVSPDSLACKSSSGFTTVEQLPTAAEDEGPNFTADSASSVPCIV